MTAVVTAASGASARRLLSSPGALGFSVVFAPIVVSVISALWRAAAEASGGSIAGYDGRSVTWYLITSEAAILCISTRLIVDTGTAIGDGSLTAELLRPRRPVLVRLAVEAGASLVRLAAILPGLALLGALVVGRPPSSAGVALAVPSLVLAVLCNLAGQHVVAAAAFWLRDATSAWFLHQKAVFLLGGMLIPLQAMPGGLATAAIGLPFAAMAYAPARLASGHVEPALLLLQLGWLAVLLLAARLAFDAGERHLVGATT